MKTVNNTHGVHTWNSKTGIIKEFLPKEDTEGTALNALGEKYCPKVYKIVNGKWFDKFD